ncbi:PRC and DUF2382 domain-containing protein [Streptomyces sp. NRRL S-350]|uniref:PRC and DUF2382 domain-containing protein n=1 Tax=Streptomyces sp. NRRL S-350 TaxID=1463902 RepID=UPI00099BB96A|nr:PRC and DUF2382 domain-containing protein [Streptomyces sp. NRRL S-350]
MQTDIDPRDLIGHKAVDRSGDKIGTVDEVYLDDATGRPEWAAVRTGIFGRDAFVPLTTSEFSGDELRVPYDKSLVKESPDFGVGQHLSPAQELQLYRYYGLDTSVDGHGADEDGGRAAQPDLDFGTAAAATTTAKPLAFRSHEPGPATTVAPVNHSPSTATEAPVQTVSTPAPVTTALAPTPATEPRFHQAPAASSPSPAPGTAPSAPTGPVEITCHEERLDITTEWHTVGTAKLRKYVTTEQIERRVPVVRERVRVERVPVSDAERTALSDKEIAEAVEEVTLREERPAVRKYLTPIERVRLVVERYTDEEVIRDELRREHVEVHDDTASQAAAAPAPDMSHAEALRPVV